MTISAKFFAAIADSGVAQWAKAAQAPPLKSVFVSSGFFGFMCMSMYSLATNVLLHSATSFSSAAFCVVAVYSLSHFVAAATSFESAPFTFLTLVEDIRRIISDMFLLQREGAKAWRRSRLDPLLGGVNRGCEVWNELAHRPSSCVDRSCVVLRRSHRPSSASIDVRHH